MLAGCATTARERWVDQRNRISVAQDTAIELHRQNVLGDAALLSIEPWMKSARSYNGKAYFLIDTAPDQAMRQMELADRQLLLTTLFIGGSTRDAD